MKLDQRYHCFGCGADGDVIDFAAALYGLTSLAPIPVATSPPDGLSISRKSVLKVVRRPG